MANYVKKKTLHIHYINITRGKTIPDFIMSSLLLLKTDTGLEIFF